ncbi:hypothetical protein LK07_27410 [Streptomyces pluripotens]|uniref:Cucumopine synthase C-terminal helical bundle domain-containing protein n=1 Tax=Streptomyces pluripotens TaxID=1355015 RepID=A0A221P4C8_9ACTN|nr:MULTISPECIES: hypothetical protein [Streptomyces]ARP72883.1 hypothetical protein LK06_026255 [Streptomyces pluripotens]ASN27133.1 hypothetical protein LK07_27410 [Streptomyces pluripotens]MCH0559878.1 hypothetical protein [Streptomyces sp. MUM 16J]
MRQIEIAWQSIGAKVRVSLDEGRNAQLVEPLWASLPYQTLQGHALVAGDCIYHVPPAHDLLHAVPDYKVDRKIQPDGTVFCSAVQHLTIKYGDLTEPMPTAPIGSVVPEDLDALPKIGQMVWDAVHGNGAPILAQVRRVNGESGHGVRRMPTESARARDLVERISAETERVLIEPTDELIAAHEGRFDTGAGTKNSVLTTLVCINGETRPLGYVSHTGLVRAARLTDVPLSALVEMARILLVKPTEFLGYCGLNTLWNLTQEVVAVIEETTSKEDFIALLSHMATYTNALGAWNLQLFPWELEGDTWTFRPTITRSAHA